MSRTRNIFLVGPMGSGKTTIGQRLAQKLGLKFHDSDHEIEATTGASVNLIFDIEGESGFRERETRMLDKLSQMSDVLVATGGGIVLSEKNRQILKQGGTVVYLSTSVEQQLDRLRRDKTRPLLQTDDKQAKLLELAEIRNPLYESVADITVTIRGRNVDGTIHSIMEALKQFNASSQPAGQAGEASHGS